MASRIRRRSARPPRGRGRGCGRCRRSPRRRRGAPPGRRCGCAGGARRPARGAERAVAAEVAAQPQDGGAEPRRAAAEQQPPARVAAHGGDLVRAPARIVQPRDAGVPEGGSGSPARAGARPSRRRARRRRGAVPAQDQPPAAVECHRRRAAAAHPPRRRRDARDAVAVEGRVARPRGGQPPGDEGRAPPRRARPRPPARSARRAATSTSRARPASLTAAESTTPPLPNARVRRAVGEQPHDEHRATRPRSDRARQHELALGLQRHRLEPRARRPDGRPAGGAEVRVEVAAGLQPRDREPLQAGERHRAGDEDAPVAEQRDARAPRQ